jgi:hypothetical protein
MQPLPPAAPTSHGLARAFLALTDDAAPLPAQHSAVRVVAALAAAVVLALSAPAGWLAPASVTAKVGDQPAATLGNSKAALAHDDEDDDGAE